MRPLPEGWTPSLEKAKALDAEFGSTVDLSLSLRRFRNHYAEGQTSRNWDARFENWVISDAQRVTANREGTDDMGIPYNQKKVRVEPAQPGDPDYFDPEEYLRQTADKPLIEEQP
jgi:hypothetical protein